MSDCREYEVLFEDLMAGEIEEADLAALQAHGETCAACADLLELHRDLGRLAGEVSEEEREALREVRGGVMAKIASGEGRADGAAGVRNPRSPFSLRRRHAWAAAAAAVILLLGGAAIGRWSAPAPALDDQLTLHAVRQLAARERGLDEYWDSPYSFENVAVRSEPGNEVVLSFDVSRHVETRTARTSPLAREVLLHAILEPSSLGSRVNAMELTAQITDDRLKRAMILTMHSDPSLTVRVNALAVLKRYPYDDEIQTAMLKTLSDDPEVQMRLLALEYLAAQEVGMEKIRGALEEDASPAGRAVLQEVSHREHSL